MFPSKTNPLHATTNPPHNTQQILQIKPCAFLRLVVDSLQDVATRIYIYIAGAGVCFSDCDILRKSR